MRGDAKSEHFQWVALLATCGAVNCVRNILVIEKPIDAAVAMHAPKIWKSVPELWKSEDVSARLHVSVVIRLRGLTIYGIKSGLTVCFIEGIFDICLHDSSTRLGHSTSSSSSMAYISCARVAHRDAPSGMPPAHCLKLGHFTYSVHIYVCTNTYNMRTYIPACILTDACIRRRLDTGYIDTYT